MLRRRLLSDLASGRAPRRRTARETHASAFPTTTRPPFSLLARAALVGGVAVGSWGVNASADAVERVRPFIVGTEGYCVQVRSVDDAAEATRLAQAMGEKAGARTTIFVADLGERGVWHRVCVGEFSTENEAKRMGQRWSSSKGALAPLMDPPKRGEARFLVKRTDASGGRALSAPQAEVLLDGKPSKTRPVHLLETGAPGSYLAAMTRATATGLDDVLFVDAAGRTVTPDLSATPGCAACRAALEKSPVAERSIVAVGDLGPWPGPEVAVVQLTGDGSRVLSVVAQGGEGLQVTSTMWMGADRATLRVLADVELKNADDDDVLELAVRRTEVTVLDDKVCAVRERAELVDVRADGPVRLDVGRIGALGKRSDGGRAAIAAIEALDALGAHAQASEACAAYVVHGRSGPAGKLCVDRIDRLAKAGRVVEAVNAAGMLSEASSLLRPVAAAAFFRAAQALDGHPGKTVRADDCASAPLATLEGKDLAAVARAALKEKLGHPDLGELADAVFVTGRRDFGPDTPVGKLIAGWLEDLRTSLPARHAAIQALAGPGSSIDLGGAP